VIAGRVLAPAVLAVALGWAHVAPAQPRVVMAHGAQSAGMAPLWVAAANGYFRKHGVDLDLRFIRGSTVTTAALVSGQASMAIAALTQIVGPVLRGADLVVVATLVDRLPYRFVVAPHVRGPDDLRGRKLGVSTLAGASHLATRMALQALGLDPRRDGIGLLQIGTEPDRVAALAAGSVDGVVMTPGAAARLPTSYRTLLDLRRAEMPWIHLGVVTTRGFLRTSPGAVEAVLRAISEGAAFALDSRNADGVKGILARAIGLEAPAALAESYRDVLDGVAWKPIPALAGAASVLRALADSGVMPEAARLPPSAVIEPGPMRVLDDEGWLDRLGRSP
jgi:NitT/TauT family transport system substrate-binding protein